MEVEITVNYNMPADEYDQLGSAYPLGKYVKGSGNERIQWFKLVIPGDTHKITLTWFKSWTE